jgi:hypothetical protein
VIRIVLMPVRFRIWTGTLLNEQEFMWAIIEKEFCKRDCNCCRVTLCDDYFRKKRSQDAVFSSPGLHPGKSTILFTYLCSKSIFFQKQLRYLGNSSFFASFFCLCITFKGVALHLKAIERRVVNTGTNDH